AAILPNCSLFDYPISDTAIEILFLASVGCGRPYGFLNNGPNQNLRMPAPAATWVGTLYTDPESIDSIWRWYARSRFTNTCFDLCGEAFNAMNHSAQFFGWVGTFILGISLYTLPTFRVRSAVPFHSAGLCGRCGAPASDCAGLPESTGSGSFSSRALRRRSVNPYEFPNRCGRQKGK